MSSADPGSAPWADSFDRVFAERSASVHERVWRAVYGADYPDGVDPHSYLSASELARFVTDGRLRPGDTLLDVGCGSGGVGLHVAEHTGARLVGIDISEVALDQARQRAATGPVADRAEFRLGEFADTGLPPGGVHAVLSVDALTFATDKPAALTELARVLAPGGRLMFTSWDYRADPPGRPPQVDDHRPLLREAGFTVLDYAETEAWRHRWEQTNLEMIAAEADLVAEVGTGKAAQVVDGMRRQLVEQIPLAIRRVLVIAQR